HGSINQAMTGSDTYRSRLYETYVSTHLIDEPPLTVGELERLAGVFRAQIGRFLPASLASSMLDIGCGPGRLVWFLQNEGYRDVRGIDISVEQVQVARSLGIANVICGEARDYLLEHTGEFDLILAFDVLEHLTKAEVVQMLDA